MVEYIDNAVIGGGVYGSYAAAALAEAYPNHHTVLFESEDEIFGRASLHNHGRLHLGYQYPNHLETARQTHDLASRFISDHGDCIDFSGMSYYGIHRGSSVSAEQYSQFCETLGLEYEQAADYPDGLFGEDIVAVFRTDELTFSTAALKRQMAERLRSSGAEVRLGTPIDSVNVLDRTVDLYTQYGDCIRAKNVFNCSYANINAIHANSGIPQIPSVYENTLLFDVMLPDELRGTTVTVLYGGFASFVSSSEGGHKLGHVIHSKMSRSQQVPKPVLADTGELEDRFGKIIDESSGYLPVLSEAQTTGWLVETKCSAGLDPTRGDRKVGTYEDYLGMEGYHVILGGKVSNYYEAGDFALTALSGRIAKAS